MILILFVVIMLASLANSRIQKSAIKSQDPDRIYLAKLSLIIYFGLIGLVLAFFYRFDSCGFDGACAPESGPISIAIIVLGPIVGWAMGKLRFKNM